MDMGAKTIYCGGDLVATVSVSNNDLQIEYSAEWGSWSLFAEDAVLKDTVEKARAKLVQHGGKGKSKGKLGPEE